MIPGDIHAEAGAADGGGFSGSSPEGDDSGASSDATGCAEIRCGADWGSGARDWSTDWSRGWGSGRHDDLSCGARVMMSAHVSIIVYNT